jgi:hypothetical protein
MSEKELILSECDFLDFREYFQQQRTVAAIMQLGAYRQGYLDCVRLLQMLGVLLKVNPVF